MKHFFIFISLFTLISCKKDGVTTPAVKTTSVNIDKNNNVATVNGEVTAEGASAVTKRGFVWSTVVNPTVSDASSFNQFGPGVFTEKISGLSLGTTYYVRAYATNANGTAYGNQLEFKTLTAGKFTSISTDSLLFTSVKINVNIESLGDISIKSMGICYSKSGTPSFNNDSTSILHSNINDKSFSISIKNLTTNTKYFARAFINTNLGIFYSNEIDFTTKQYTTGTFGDIVITSLSNTGADAKVNISSLGDAPIKSMGLCFSTTNDPIFKLDSSTLIHSNNTDQVFTLVLKNIKENTKYFIRAFINSDAGIVYSKSFFFTTLGRPTLADINPNSAIITRTTANFGTYVISENGGQVSENGFFFGDKKIIVPVNGSLKINHELTSLIGNTNYSVYAFATNKYGTGVSKVYNFLTGPTEPVITTAPITDIFSSNAKSSVIVNSNGGSEIIEYGICISYRDNPTVLDRFYTSTSINNKILLTNLTYDSAYKIRAYAKNKVGISYGNQLSFVTEYQVGEKGPAGGVIFYDKVSKDNGWRYLETTYTDVDLIGPAGCNLTVEINTDSAIGFGLENTAKIIEKCNEALIGAKLAKSYRLNDFNDWFLPSYFELKKIYESNVGQSTTKALLTKYNPNNQYLYLSSTQKGIAGASMLMIDANYQIVNTDNGRKANNIIRPVRRFK
jgi:hypothetical protein